MLQEKKNMIEVIGTLSEVDLEPKTKDGKEYITGKIVIKSQPKGQETPLEIEFRPFAYKFKKNSTDINPAFESILNVKENMTSIAACGDPEQATRIRVYTTNGGLRENSFYNQAGILVETVRPNSSFFNVAPPKYEDKAFFNTIIFVSSIEDEVNRDGEPTGRLKVVGAVPGYGGTINKVTYIAEGENKIDYIKTYWNKADTVEVAGTIAYTTKVEEVVKEVGFGDPIVEQHSVTKRELLISSGSQEALPEEEAFNPKDIFEAMQERKAKLDAEKDNAQPKKANTQDYGF